MRRLCERPGCSTPAAVAYGFDAEQLIVWLDATTIEGQGTRFGVLCLRHADAMIVPLGWMLDDRREPTLRLFKAPATAVPAARAPRERRPRPDDTGQLRLLAEAAAALDAESACADVAPDADALAAEDPGATQPIPGWVPVFDPNDDLAGLLNARGRLLSRAFGSTPPDDR